MLIKARLGKDDEATTTVTTTLTTTKTTTTTLFVKIMIFPLSDTAVRPYSLTIVLFIVRVIVFIVLFDADYFPFSFPLFSFLLSFSTSRRSPISKGISVAIIEIAKARYRKSHF